MSQARLSLFSGVSCTFGNIHSLKRNSSVFNFHQNFTKFVYIPLKKAKNECFETIFCSPRTQQPKTYSSNVSYSTDTAISCSSLLPERGVSAEANLGSAAVSSAANLGSFLLKLIQTIVGKWFSWRNMRGPVRRRWPCSRAVAKLEITLLSSEQMPRQMSAP